MPYDESTAERVRQVLEPQPDVVEKSIVGGGLGFMVGGYLCCGVSANGLTVRVGPENQAEAVTEPHVGPLLIGEREAGAFVVVAPDGYAGDDELREWVDRGLRFVSTLPPRSAK